jgi:hypothetical protein
MLAPAAKKEGPARKLLHTLRYVLYRIDENPTCNARRNEMPEIVKNTEMSAMTLYAKRITVLWISAQATDDPSRRISNRTSRLARS